MAFARPAFRTGEILRGNADLLRQFIEPHLPLSQHDIEIHDKAHGSDRQRRVLAQLATFLEHQRVRMIITAQTNGAMGNCMLEP